MDPVQENYDAEWRIKWRLVYIEKERGIKERRNEQAKVDKSQEIEHEINVIQTQAAYEGTVASNKNMAETYTQIANDPASEEVDREVAKEVLRITKEKEEKAKADAEAAKEAADAAKAAAKAAEEKKRKDEDKALKKIEEKTKGKYVQGEGEGPAGDIPPLGYDPTLIHGAEAKEIFENAAKNSGLTLEQKVVAVQKELKLRFG